MIIPLIHKVVDERFLTHRLKSSSLAGIFSSVLAVALFEYRYFIGHVWSWDLFSIPITFVVVKLSVLFWYRIND